MSATTDESLAKPPGLLTFFVTPLLRHGATVLAGVLLAHGMVQQDMATQLQQVLVAIALGAFSYGWSLYEKYQHRDNAAVMVSQAKAIGRVQGAVMATNAQAAPAIPDRVPDVIVPDNEV